MSTKKILIVTDNLPNQINGVVTTFKNIASYAEKDGYELCHINPTFFHYIDAPRYPEVRLSWPWGIAKLIRDHNPDYIHIATEGPLGIAASNYCWRNNLRYNTSYHTKFPEFLKKIYNIPESLTYRYVRWFHKHSGKVLTTTQTMVNELKANGFIGKIYGWTRGVDKTVFIDGLRNEDIKNQSILLSVGRVSKEKNLDAFCQLDIPNTIKIIVGDGPYRKELEIKYPNVKFVGVKTGTELARYYANADVFVFPSRVDTFGIVMIESISMGTPVAAYPVPGPIDIIENNVTGILNDDLEFAVKECLQLSRGQVKKNSNKWTWENCWEIFRDNLVTSK